MPRLAERKLKLGGKYRVMESDDWRSKGDVGTAIQETGCWLLLFKTKNKGLTCWPNGWYTYSPGWNTNVEPVIVLDKNKLGNFPRKKAVKSHAGH